MKVFSVTIILTVITVILGIYGGTRVKLLNSNFFIKCLVVIGYECFIFISAVLLYKLFSMFNISNKIILDKLFQIIFMIMTSIVTYKWVQEYTYWLISVLIFICPVSILYFWCFGEKTLQHFFLLL